MTNFEWIKGLNKEDLAKWLANQKCANICSYGVRDEDCVEENYPCIQGILSWLNSERRDDKSKSI